MQAKYGKICEATQVVDGDKQLTLLISAYISSVEVNFDSCGCWKEKMDHTKDDHFAKISQTRPSLSIMKKGQKDSKDPTKVNIFARKSQAQPVSMASYKDSQTETRAQRQVQSMTKSKESNDTKGKELFMRLRAWKEESNRTFFNILRAYCRDIDKGMQDLADELSEVKQEKDVLLETVDDLHGEIRQLNAKLQWSEPGKIPEEDTQEIYNYDEQTFLTENDPGREKISSAYDDQEKTTNFETLSEEIIQKGRKNLSNESGLLIESVFTDNSLDNGEAHLPNSELMKDEIQVLDEKQDQLRRKRGPLKKKHQPGSPSKGTFKKAQPRKFACNLCEHTSTSGPNLDYHKITVHNIGEKLQCEQCPYKSASKANMKAHNQAVHEKIRKYACEECKYATARKKELAKHMESKKHLATLRRKALL